MKTFLFILCLASAVSVQANALNLYDSLKGTSTYHDLNNV